MQLFEMQGLLAGKCLPGDLLVGESIAKYLLRQINQRDELARQVSALQTSQDNIINGLGIKGDGPVSKLVIEYVLGLVAERDALAAENAALKEGAGFFMYSEDTGFELHKTREEAIASAQDMIVEYRKEASSDGWPEEAGAICWGVIMQKATESEFEKPSEENGWIGWSEYLLSPAVENISNEAANLRVGRKG